MSEQESANGHLTLNEPKKSGSARRWDGVLRWLSDNGKFLLQLAGAVVAVVLAALVVRGTLLAPTSIGSPATESDALIRANERLLEMAKWTISTILLLGGALIGLNWYSNEQRYARDRREQENRIDNLQKSLNTSLATTASQYLDLQEQALESKLEVNDLHNQVLQGLLYPEGNFPPEGYAARVLALVDGHQVTPRTRRQLLNWFISTFESAETKTPFLTYLGLEFLPDIANAAEKHKFIEEATRARAAYNRLSNAQSEEL